MNGYKKRVLNKSPEMLVMDDVVTAAEAAEVIKLATPRLKRSKASEKKNGKTVFYEAADITSWYTAFEKEETALIAKLEQRIAQMLEVDKKRLEHLKCIRYLPGERAGLHTDFLTPEFIKSSHDPAGERLMTVILYLNDMQAGDDGGCTRFPKLNISVHPKQGSCLVWDNVKSNGEVDFRTVHEGTAPKKSTKFVLATFVREKEVAAS